MTDDLNSVKTTCPSERAYHHGALRSALLSAAEALIEERGLDRFSLRETARRAGVSPAAPAHHFGDARGLLTAIATEGFRELGDALEEGGCRRGPARAHHGAGACLCALRIGPARAFHLDVAQGNPRRRRSRACRGRSPRFPDSRPCGSRRECGAERSARSRACPFDCCWSIVHGFALLALDGAFGSDEGRSSKGGGGIAAAGAQPSGGLTVRPGSSPAIFRAI